MSRCFKAISSVQKTCTGLHGEMVNTFAVLTLLRTVNFHVQQLRGTTSLHIQT